jgi:hypothetical protein
MGRRAVAPLTSRILAAAYATLPADQKRMVDAIVAQSRQTGIQTRTDYNGPDFYAHPHGSGGTAWGVDGGPNGWNVARGVMPK